MVPKPVLQSPITREISDHQVYDWLILLDREIEYVWRSKWTIPKALFVISRYGTLLERLIFTAGESDIVRHPDVWNGD